MTARTLSSCYKVNFSISNDDDMAGKPEKDNVKITII